MFISEFIVSYCYIQVSVRTTQGGLWDGVLSCGTFYVESINSVVAAISPSFGCLPIVSPVSKKQFLDLLYFNLLIIQASDIFCQVLHNVKRPRGKMGWCRIVYGMVRYGMWYGMGRCSLVW